MHQESTPLWKPGEVPSKWTDVCGLVMPPTFQTEWLIREHGAPEIDRKDVGVPFTRPDKPL